MDFEDPKHLEVRPFATLVDITMGKILSHDCLFAQFVRACVRWIESHWADISMIRVSRDGLIEVSFLRDGKRAKNLMFECLSLPDGRDCVSKQDGHK